MIWVFRLTVNWAWATTSPNSADAVSFTWDNSGWFDSLWRRRRWTHWCSPSSLIVWTPATVYWSASTVSCYRGCRWFRTPQLVSSLEPGGSSTWRQCYATFTSYQYGKGSSSRRPYWYTSVFMAWLHHTWHHTAHRSLLKLDVRTCDPRQQDNSLCRVLGQFTVVVALLYTAL